MVPASPLALRDRATIARLLLERRAPSICAFREVMEAGALMSYGVNLVDCSATSRRSWTRWPGAARPARFRCGRHRTTTRAFNLKTAKSLGIEVPGIAARPRRRGDRIAPARCPPPQW